MTDLLRPLTGFLPAARYAGRVVGPPVAMLAPEQREAARQDPLSFRHVIGRGAGTSPEEAAAWLRSCTREGVLTPVGPAVFAYRIESPDHTATGVVAEVSVAAYQAGRIKRHEKTRDGTLQAMAGHMRSVRINGNPVALAHRPAVALEEAVAKHTGAEPDLMFIAADGLRHSLWTVPGDEAWDLCRLFTDDVYITDGHHRLAAAAAVAAAEGADHHIPAGLFSMSELRLRAFARCVVDPAVDPALVVDRLAEEFALERVGDVAAARPTAPHQFGVVVGGKPFVLHLDGGQVPDDLLGALDVVLLQQLILGPLFGITDPRADERLHFAPDTAGPDANIDCTAWFLPYPASVADVMEVADAGAVMPPKSTWFEPKLPSGLVVRLLE